MNARSVTFEVLGQPQPQGSMRPWRVRSGAVVTVYSNQKVLMPWRQAIAATASVSWSGGPSEMPISVTLVFHLKKPKSARRSDVWPTKRPDDDKLVRAVLDALAGICYRDDSQVVHICATKVYAPTPSLLATVTEMGQINGA